MPKQGKLGHVWAMYLEELPKAEAEGKVLVVSVRQKGRTGSLLVINDQDLFHIAKEHVQAMGYKLVKK